MLKLFYWRSDPLKLLALPAPLLHPATSSKSSHDFKPQRSLHSLLDEFGNYFGGVRPLTTLYVILQEPCLSWCFVGVSISDIFKPWWKMHADRFQSRIPEDE